MNKKMTISFICTLLAFTAHNASSMDGTITRLSNEAISEAIYEIIQPTLPNALTTKSNKEAKINPTKKSLKIIQELCNCKQQKSKL